MQNNGDGTFTDLQGDWSSPAGAAGLRYQETHSVPVLADFDLDGALDLSISAVYPGRPTDLYWGGGDGHFTLDVAFEAATAPPTGDTCDDPLVLTSGEPLSASLSDKQDDYVVPCSFFFRDAVHRFTLAERSDVTIEADGGGPFMYVAVRSACETPDDELRCVWRPESHHEAFPGMLNGGITGALLDCHSNWTAAYHLMRARALDAPPCTVTADFHVTLKRPTPMNAELTLLARVLRAEGDKVTVEATLEASGKITATCLGTFVAVREGHPAYHRW